MDIDTTVKLLYRHQEYAQVGYNPTKPGSPSHAYHSYFIANLRMVMDVDVQAGNQTASSFAHPGMWEMLDGLEGQCRPAFVRGDCAWGAERAMAGAEQRAIPYLFKLKQSPNATFSAFLRTRPAACSKRAAGGRLWGNSERDPRTAPWQGRR
jgi:hypothetical protein